MGTKEEPGNFDCYAAAGPDEPIFVLLARDQTAPQTVRQWADARMARLRNFDGQTTAQEVLAEVDQIAEARRCADEMEHWREYNR